MNPLAQTHLPLLHLLVPLGSQGQSKWIKFNRDKMADTWQQVSCLNHQTFTLFCESIVDLPISAAGTLQSAVTRETAALTLTGEIMLVGNCVRTPHVFHTTHKWGTVQLSHQTNITQASEGQYKCCIKQTLDKLVRDRSIVLHIIGSAFGQGLSYSIITSSIDGVVRHTVAFWTR